MIITCPCGEKKFEIADNLIPDKGRLLKCGSCDKTWFYKKETKLHDTISTEKAEQKTLTKEKNLDLEDKNINQLKQKLSNNKKSQLVKYKPSSSFTIGKFLNYTIVSLITFVAIIIILDTFKTPLSSVFPNLELILYNLFETLRDLILFVKDLS